MEDRINQMKSQMLKGELADFEFTPEMKERVVQRMTKKRFYSIRRLVPAGLSFALVGVFLAGIYFLIDSNYTANPEPTTPSDSATHGQEEKPELIHPGYIPEPYIFKHTYTNDEIHEHVYVNPEDENETFSYIIHSGDLQLDEGSTQEIQLTADIGGIIVEVAEDHSYVSWEDDGFKQVVEQEGTMSKVDLFKIVDSILIEKGHNSLLASEIEKLEKNEAQPTEDEVSEDEPINEELSEEEAIDLLLEFEERTRSISADRENLKYKNLSTKEEYYQLFLDLMPMETIVKLSEYRLEEKQDGLYAVPTEFPAFYSQEDPYNFSKISDHQYLLTQNFQGGLYSSITATFTTIDGKWMILDIEGN